MKWQTIDSAPRNGTFVLVGWFGIDAVSGTEWSDYPPHVLKCYTNGKWWDDYGREYMTPTHWMRLPAPPERVVEIVRMTDGKSVSLAEPPEPTP